MDLKAIVKNKIIDEILHYGYSKEERRMFIYDENTVDILNSVLSYTEILSCEIVAMQTLEDEAREGGKEFGAIYFTKLNKKRLKIINRDIKNKRYKYFKIVCIDGKDLMESIKPREEDVSCKHIHLNFNVSERRVFTFENIKNLEDLGHCLKLNFNMNYMNNTGVEDICNNFDLKHNTIADVLILKREIDLYTPLLHFFDLYSFLNDIDILEGNFYKEKNKYLDSNLWKEIKYAHVAEINKILSKKSHNLVKGVKKLDGDIPFKDLSKMVLQAPENIRLKEEVIMFLDLADKLINKFQQNQLNILSVVEQNIATGYDVNQNKYKNGIQDMFNILKDDKFTKEDKLRLFLLILSSGNNLENNEIETIQNLHVFTKEEIKIKEKIFKMKEYFQKKKAPVKEFDYDITRYKPLIDDLIRHFVKGKDFFIKLNKKVVERKEPSSMRKSEFVFSSEKNIYRNKKIIIIVILGGISYQEIKTVYQLSEYLGIEIIIGAEKIFNAKKYIEYLMN